MAELYTPEGFFVTTLSSDINASTATIPLTAVPSTVTKGYMVIEPNSSTKREVIHFTSVGASTVTAADDTGDGTDATGRGCKGSITAGANTSHDQGVTVIIAATYNYWKRLVDKLNGSDSTVLVDSSGNEILKTSSVASAVNEVTIKNAATGSGPEVQATGGDTNIDLKLVPKGTGAVAIPGTSTSSAAIKLYEDTDNGTNYMALKAPAAVTADKTLILPDGVGSAGQALVTDGVDTLSWSSIGNTDGWTSSSDTWVYASASTFTIAGVDRTAIFTKGTRLKFTQTTAKYAVVVSSSFSTNTTVTIAVNTDYTIANAAITSPYYSYQATPAGYPTYFNNTGVTVRGSGGSLGSYAETAKSYKFRITGNECYIIFKTSVTNNGSWSGDLRLPIPVTAADATEILFGNAINQGVSWGSTGAIINYGPAYPSSTNILFKKALDTNDVQITDMTAQYVVIVNGAFTF